MKMPVLLTVVMLSATVSYGYVETYQITKEDLPHTPLLVNCSTNGTEVSFVVLLQERGVLYSIHNVRLYLRDEKGDKVFQSEMHSELWDLFGRERSIKKYSFDISESFLKHSTLEIWAGGPGQISVIYQIPLDLLFKYFLGHKESYGGFTGDDTELQSHPVVLYFERNKFAPEPVYERMRNAGKKEEPSNKASESSVAPAPQIQR